MIPLLNRPIYHPARLQVLFIVLACLSLLGYAAEDMIKPQWLRLYEKGHILAGRKLAIQKLKAARVRIENAGDKGNGGLRKSPQGDDVIDLGAKEVLTPSQRVGEIADTLSWLAVMLEMEIMNSVEGDIPVEVLNLAATIRVTCQKSLTGIQGRIPEGSVGYLRRARVQQLRQEIIARKISGENKSQLSALIASAKLNKDNKANVDSVVALDLGQLVPERDSTINHDQLLLIRLVGDYYKALVSKDVLLMKACLAQGKGLAAAEDIFKEQKEEEAEEQESLVKVNFIPSTVIRIKKNGKKEHSVTVENIERVLDIKDGSVKKILQSDLFVIIWHDGRPKIVVRH